MPAPFRKTLFRGYSSVSNRNIRTLFDVLLVKQDLLNHFNTRKNERVRSCTYGSLIQDMIFELKVDGTAQKLLDEVTRIIKSENRVRIVEIKLNEFEYGITIECLLDFIGLDVQDNFVLQFDKDNGLVFSDDLKEEI